MNIQISENWKKQNYKQGMGWRSDVCKQQMKQIVKNEFIVPFRYFNIDKEFERES